MSGLNLDFSELAKAFGAVSSQPRERVSVKVSFPGIAAGAPPPQGPVDMVGVPAEPIDYTALANEFGAITPEVPQPQAPITPQNPPVQPQDQLSQAPPTPTIADKLLAHVPPDLEEQIKKATPEPTAYAKWWQESIPKKLGIPVGRPLVPGTQEFTELTGKESPAQPMADWMGEVSEQLSQADVLAGSVPVPKLMFRGKPKQWVTSKLEKPPAGEPIHPNLDTSVEVALNRINQVMKRSPEAGVPVHPTVVIGNPKTDGIILGRITPEQWIENRLSLFKTPQELQAARDWYRDLLGVFTARYGAKEAPQKLIEMRHNETSTRE